MKKTVYLGLSILEFSKILMYEIWYDYLKPKYDEKTKLWYGYVNRDDISKDIAEDVESRADTSNYDLDRASSKEKKKKVIRLMKDELAGEIMTNLLG